MAALGFLNIENAPTDDAKNALPPDLTCPPADVLDQTVVFFHDESTFQLNKDQSTYWETKDTHIMKLKSRGAGIMVSDFIEERSGYIAFTQQEYNHAKVTRPHLWMHARLLLEYGESREEYWTSDRFIAQLEKAVEIAEVKYPIADGFRHVWIFDHSSCHGAMAGCVKMNVNPGGKQWIMHDGWWNGKPQKMNYSLGIPKGLRAVLEERGVNTKGMNGEKMREILGSHNGFKNVKSRVEQFLAERGHIVYMLPKFHCELNSIERVWAQAKCFTKAYCKYSPLSP